MQMGGVRMTSNQEESGCRKKRSAQGVRSLCFIVGHVLVTFSDASVTFFATLFAKAPFAGLLLWQSERGYSLKKGS